MLRWALRRHRRSLLLRLVPIVCRQQHQLSVVADAGRKRRKLRTGYFSYDSFAGKLDGEVAKAVAYILQSGIKSLRVFSRYLIRMYGACSGVQDALKAFDRLQVPTAASWLELVTAFAQNGHCEEAFWAFRRMLLTGMKPNEALLIVLLSACQGEQGLEDGMFLHSCIVELGIQDRATMAAALLSMYGRCGRLDMSRDIFQKMTYQDATSWNSMLAVLVHCGRDREALEFFKVMQEVSGFVPSKQDYILALRACRELSQVQAIHEYLVIWDYEKDPVVAAALMESYGDCGGTEQCAVAFNYALPRQKRKMSRGPEELLVWNSLIRAYAKNGLGNEAVTVFHKMQLAKARPNTSTFVAVLEACSQMAALMEGKLLHRRVIDEEGLQEDGTIASSLIRMYSECAVLEESTKIFAAAISDGEPSAAHWKAMILALSRHGYTGEALQLLVRMQQSGWRADAEALDSLLFGFCCSGLAEEGLAFFASVKNEYGVEPSRAHLVELVARTAGLRRAEELVNRLSVVEDRKSVLLSAWLALLTAARNFEDTELAKKAAAKAFTLEPRNASVNAVLLSLYSKAGRLDVVERMKMKTWSCCAADGTKSWIELGGVVHEFSSINSDSSSSSSSSNNSSNSNSDSSSSNSNSSGRSSNSSSIPEELRVVLKNVEQMMQGGSTIEEVEAEAELLALHDVEGEQGCGADALWLHCEKLAVAYGLLNTRKRERLRVFKNRRMCRHCHSVMGFISAATQREIVVRDSSRFHCFQATSTCSCLNYW